MNFTTATARRKRTPRTYPLHIRIGFLFSLLILVTGLVISGFSYLSARSAARDAADNAMTSSAAQMISTIKQLYSPMDTLVGLLAYHQVTSAKTLEERLESLHFFREAMMHNPQISAVYAGYDNGDFFLVRHLRRAEIRISAKAPEGAVYLVQSIERNTAGKIKRRFLYYDTDLKLVRADLRPDYSFDPRTRPWFRQDPDKLSGATLHTDPYLFFTTREIGQTFSRRAINGKAVVAADLTLIDLSETLARQKVTPSTELVLFDLQGHILGYKDPSRLVGPDDDDGNPTLNHVEQLGVPIISRAYLDLARRGLTDTSTTLKESGREWYVRIQPLQTLSAAGKGNAAKTFLAIAAPANEVFAYALRIRNEMLMVTLLIILLAIPITWWLAARVTLQLKDLSRQADDIKNFRFHTPEAAASNIYEIEHLSSTIAQLKGTIGIIDGSPIPAFVIGKNHLVIHWNKALHEISGIGPDDVVGTSDHWRAFYSEERPCMADLMVDEAVESVPLWYYGKYSKPSLLKGVYEATDFFPGMGEDGKWLHITAAAIRDSKGTIVAAIETLEDITEHEKMANALKVSEEKFSKTFHNAPLLMSINEIKNGKYIDVNEKFIEVSGFSREEVLGKTSMELGLISRKDVIRLLKKLKHQKVIENLELNCQSKDKRQICCLYSCEVIPVGEKQVLLSLLQDITEKKKIEEEKIILEERLQRSEKMEALGTLAGGVAHDLNNVLGVIVGYAELLLIEVDKFSPIRPRLTKIMNSSDKAAAIVQDLLTLARRGVSGINVLNLNKLIFDYQNSPEFEKLSSYNSGIRIKTYLEPGLLNISGSSVHLGKALFNLVANALEAMPKGGELTIKTANQYLDKPIHGYDDVQEGDYVVLSVYDTGEGIPAKDLQRIFEPFYTKKVMGKSGTGLGLAVVWGTVKDHQGYINVKSEEGKGSTFTLYFPVTREDITKAPTPVSISEYMGKAECILVVDDVREQRDLATEMLKKLNYRVSSVASGEEAITYIKEHAVDLLVLDMIMDPGMDGLDTYKCILEIQPKQKAIIVSGFSETERVNEAHALGAGAYVKKPYVIEKLGMGVRKELDRSV